MATATTTTVTNQLQHRARNKLNAINILLVNIVMQ